LRGPARKAGLGHPFAAPKIRGEQMPSERNREDHDEQDDRHDLCDRDDLVDRSSLLHPAQYREVKDPDADR
jgi:hypothetical protein